MELVDWEMDDDEDMFVPDSVEPSSIEHAPTRSFGPFAYRLRSGCPPPQAPPYEPGVTERPNKSNAWWLHLSGGSEAFGVAYDLCSRCSIEA
jgi:hypothetical protein